MTTRTPGSRRKSAQVEAPSVHPLGTPTTGLRPNTGPLATAQWLLARNLTAPHPKWYVEVTLRTEAPGGTELRIELFSEEWGFWFGHEDKVSWIRVTDLPFAHGRDDHGLLELTPPLRNIGVLVRAIEERFGIRFVAEAAGVRTSLFGAELAIRDWVTSW